VNVVVQFLQLTSKYCIVNCAIQKLEVIENSTIKQHIDTDKAAIKRKQSKNKFDLQKTQQQLLSNTKKSSFNKDVCYTLLSANIIPLNKLNNHNFKSFLEKYTSKEISNQTTLRKGYVNDIYDL